MNGLMISRPVGKKILPGKNTVDDSCSFMVCAATAQFFSIFLPRG
jgi:hypothetical protein